MHLTKRGSLYAEWLRKQPAAYRAELAKAEKAFAIDHDIRLAQLELTFQDQMYGYEDAPAGPRAKPAWEVWADRHNGDWSWKPWRDKAAGDNFVTYKPAAHPNPRYNPA